MSHHGWFFGRRTASGRRSGRLGRSDLNDDSQSLEPSQLSHIQRGKPRLLAR